ncbi:hypothetical protein MPTK1_2g00380 [Marchantia polymorpha subsp. ruderalis]|uniref:Rieske domain-containing protein n=1 Tax=Marchantia polymorpha TaxID=3197 RepID=A0A2R6X9N8_MARPO|nr:hypothetical protein MARPO_0028s0113 [Marchantia polymorpha]BBN00577.1 hypothetical protein Mp_2g00380 [Marchantia polymorpha subsp. ruderalis]|eukprot:PTQ42820.1 hypothetical protein MARPO_0028s0113 [Marchantia polymorpha]
MASVCASVAVGDPCGLLLGNAGSRRWHQRASASDSSYGVPFGISLRPCTRPCSGPLPSLRSSSDKNVKRSTFFRGGGQEFAEEHRQSKRWIRPVVARTDNGSDTQKEGDDRGEHQSPEAREPEGKGQEQAGFVWKSNWYPVIPVQDLDESVPHPFEILGRKVVIWFDREFAQWRTFTDVCPHRLAPLSEGRIDENGCLQCCYHAWSFKGDGSCTRIPQARPDGPEIRAVSNTRATSFPTTIAQGILFIWPDEHGFELAEKTPPPITPQHDGPEWETVVTFRDVDYGWDTGMENLLDPSHVPVAHHMVNGGSLGKRDDAQPLSIEIKEFSQQGFNGPWGRVGGPPQFLEFEAPTRTTYVFSIGGQAMGTTTTYVTPTAPGGSRVLISNGRKAFAMKAMTSGPKWWQISPRWWDHQKMLNLLDGDESLLHGQERLLRESTNGQIEKWNQAFFMPCAADRFVSAFRQWLNRHGGKNVQWADGVDPSLPPLIKNKELLLDRYESHTKHCKVCSKALQNFRIARQALYILAAVLVGVAPLLQVWSHRIPLVVAAGISAFLAWRLGDWIQMFYYKGYDHARIP